MFVQDLKSKLDRLYRSRIDRWPVRGGGKGMIVFQSVTLVECDSSFESIFPCT